MTYEDDLSWQVSQSDNAVASIMLAHGAGAALDSDFMEMITKGLVANGINVYRFNFPYMQQRQQDGKRRPPNRMPVLVESFKQRLQRYQLDLPLFVAGKSMGSRVAAMVSEDDKVCGVIALGYPFHPISKPDNTRLEPLQALTKPALIIQGTRDALGNETEVNGYSLPNNIDIQFLEDGDHDLKPRVRSGFRHEQHIQSAVASMAAFIRKQL
ncbi:alpha/beta family hydrolase [Thalassotalea maritima]|uniref:alpha/beta family hydrolase n=1 Tax=Thalassotalea maritima TaxID=3242416 RepID=UPI0035275FA1